MSENVVSASVVLPGGECREVPGEGLRTSVEPDVGGGILVGARLRTRHSEGDLPFGFTFRDSKDLVEAVAGIVRSGAPLWHLVFLNPEMALSRGFGDRHMLFGAYPGVRAAAIEEALRGVRAVGRGRLLPPADAYRIWGERFFPVAPSHPTPKPLSREFVSVSELQELLDGAGARPDHIAVQGTVARFGKVLLLAFDTRKDDWKRRKGTDWYVKG